MPGRRRVAGRQPWRCVWSVDGPYWQATGAFLARRRAEWRQAALG